MGSSLVVCGGTFDHFHKGHESLLELAFSLGNRVIIGVTSDGYIKNSKIKIPTPIKASAGKQNSKLIESFEKRKQSVLGFIEREKALCKAEIIKIEDLFGPTLSRDLVIDGITVSEDTKQGADLINIRRKELRLNKLSIFVAPLIRAEDGKLISSARIRNGEINRMGKLYVKPEWLKTDLFLPENLRQEFQKPFGELLSDTESLIKDEGKLIIAVGDMTTKKLNQLGIDQQLSVIDFKVARRIILSSFSDLGFSGNEEIVTADNPAGHITSNLFSKVLNVFRTDFNQRIILKIEGEEDLAVLPLILTSPLGAIIYYGQPNEGLVKVLVSEDSKELAYDLVSKFKPIETHTRGH